MHSTPNADSFPYTKEEFPEYSYVLGPRVENERGQFLYFWSCDPAYTAYNDFENPFGSMHAESLKHLPTLPSMSLGDAVFLAVVGMINGFFDIIVFCIWSLLYFMAVILFELVSAIGWLVVWLFNRLWRRNDPTNYFGDEEVFEGESPTQVNGILSMIGNFMWAFLANVARFIYFAAVWLPVSAVQGAFLLLDWIFTQLIRLVLDGTTNNNNNNNHNSPSVDHHFTSETVYA